MKHRPQNSAEKHAVIPRIELCLHGGTTYSRGLRLMDSSIDMIASALKERLYEKFKSREGNSNLNYNWRGLIIYQSVSVVNSHLCHDYTLLHQEMAGNLLCVFFTVTKIFLYVGGVSKCISVNNIFMYGINYLQNVLKITYGFCSAKKRYKKTIGLSPRKWMMFQWLICCLRS